MGEEGKVRADLDSTMPDNAPATEMNAWTRYLRREECLQDSNLFRDDAERIMQLSFTELHRKFEFKSLGRGAKGKHQLKARDVPTIIVIKPRMPKHWGESGHEKRPEYCKMQLRKHKCFRSTREYNAFIFGQHDGDYEAAYEDFAKGDPQAPQACRDDFRDVIIEDDGEEIVDASKQGATADADFEIWSVNPRFEEARNRAAASAFDSSFWVGRSKERYTPKQIQDAETWQRRMAASAQPLPPVCVDLDSLNVGQRFVYRAVMEHDELQRTGKAAAKHFLVCGTAGSGKARSLSNLHMPATRMCLQS